jgi:hypothetical protein
MVATFLNPPGSLASGRMVGDKERDRPQNAIDRKPRSDDGYPVQSNTVFLRCTAGTFSGWFRSFEKSYRGAEGALALPSAL